MTSSASIIDVSKLSFAYRENRPILRDVSLSIVAGDYVGIIGPNGSGKSTFLKLLLGLLPVQQGVVRLFGQPISEFRTWSKVGYVPQTGFQGEKYFPATVAEVIAVGHLSQSFFPRRKERQALRTRIKEIAGIVGITHLLKRRIGELSGGEEQRAFIAQALVSDPDLLILDEPTAGVDWATEASFFGLLRELNEKHGKTILLVSHDLEALAHNAKTALCLNETITYYGPATGLHERQVVESIFTTRPWHHEASSKNI